MKKLLLYVGIFCAVSMVFAQNQGVRNTSPASQRITLNADKSKNLELVQNPNDPDYNVLVVGKTGNKIAPNDVIVTTTLSGNEIWQLQDGTIIKIVDASSKKMEPKQADNTQKPQERSVKTTSTQPQTKLQKYEQSVNDEIQRLERDNAKLQELQRKKSEIERLKIERLKEENEKLQELQQKKVEIERLKKENAKLRRSLGR